MLTTLTDEEAFAGKAGFRRFGTKVSIEPDHAAYRVNRAVTRSIEEWSAWRRVAHRWLYQAERTLRFLHGDGELLERLDQIATLAG